MKVDFKAAVPGWVAGRVLVAVGWFVARVAVDVRRDGILPAPMVQGLFAWDGSYYRDIARIGYEATGLDSVRFFPLYPLLGRGTLGLLLLSNLGALVGAALVHRLVREEFGDADLARRAAVLVGILPPSFVLAWAYAEGVFLPLAAGQLLALRHRRWDVAAALGVVASLTRPTGVLLAVPAAVEAWRTRRLGALVAVVAPVAGFVSFLVWVDRRFGDAFLPLRVQQDLRGDTANPVLRLLEGFGEIVTDPLGDGLHIPFVLGLIALVVVCWSRFPPAWTALAAVTVVVSVAAGNLNSIEQYGLSAVPLVVAVAAVVGGNRWRPAAVVSSAAMVAMCALAWYGLYVP